MKIDKAEPECITLTTKNGDKLLTVRYKEGCCGPYVYHINGWLSNSKTLPMGRGDADNTCCTSLHTKLTIGKAGVSDDQMLPILWQNPFGSAFNALLCGGAGTGFYCARTGVRLGDIDSGCSVVEVRYEKMDGVQRVFALGAAMMAARWRGSAGGAVRERSR